MYIRGATNSRVSSWNMFDLDTRVSSLHKVRRIDKKSEDWIKFESLFSSRRMKLFKSDKRTCAHVDVEGTGKTLVFIAKDNGAFYHYMEDYWHPDACQGAPVCIYDWMWEMGNVVPQNPSFTF